MQTWGTSAITWRTKRLGWGPGLAPTQVYRQRANRRAQMHYNPTGFSPPHTMRFYGNTRLHHPSGTKNLPRYRSTKTAGSGATTTLGTTEKTGSCRGRTTDDASLHRANPNWRRRNCLQRTNHQHPKTTLHLISPSNGLRAETSHYYDQTASHYSDHAPVARTQSTWLMSTPSLPFMQCCAVRTFFDFET
eukprot:353613-Chlamydomonas_euryale.AAC.4